MVKTKTLKLGDFEATLSKLQKMVDNLEQGELPLEKALSQFEQGIGLIRQCQTLLKQAEQKVTYLTEEADNSE